MNAINSPPHGKYTAMPNMIMVVRNTVSFYTGFTNCFAIGFRKVEGEIFRLGMLLEDIQEQTDDSKCNLSSLLTSCESACSSYSLCEVSEFY